MNRQLRDWGLAASLLIAAVAFSWALNPSLKIKPSVVMSPHPAPLEGMENRYLMLLRAPSSVQPAPAPATMPAPSKGPIGQTPGGAEVRSSPPPPPK